jgi:hypothetical protein
VASQVHIIKRLHDLGQFCHVVGVVKAGQQVQEAMKLLGPNYKQLDQNPVVLFNLLLMQNCCISAMPLQNMMSK